jgi:hypothetical protein
MKWAVYLITVFIVASAPSLAKEENYKLVRGEGGRLHAEISLDTSNSFRLEMACHSSNYVVKSKRSSAALLIGA